MRRIATAFTITAAGTAAAAGTAQAAPSIAISPAKPCYLSGETVTASGAGFNAHSSIEVKLDLTSLGRINADAAGNLAANVTLGRLRGVKSHTLTAIDGANPALVASTSFLATTNLVRVKPKRARAGRKLRLRGRGFLAGPRVYMHVRGHGYKSDKRVGRAKGPCGTFSTRRRIVPRSAATGSYRVQFDAKRRYSKKTRPRVVGRMRVTRRVGASAATASRWTRLPR